MKFLSGVVLVLSFILFVHAVAAISTHYELDKQFYYPGDSGKLLFTPYNEGFSDTSISGAEMEIIGIGSFTWNKTCVETADAPPDVYACEFKSGQTLNIEVPFKIPENAQPGNYMYTWTMKIGFGEGGWEFSGSDSINVIAAGTEPPKTFGEDLPWPMILLIAAPVLLILLAFFVARKIGQKKTERAVKDAELSEKELRIRRILGVIIALSSFAGIMWGTLFIPFALVLGVYLFKSRKHHPVADVIFLIFGVAFYFLTIPFAGPSAGMIKFFVLPADFSDIFSPLILISLVSKILALSYAIFSLASNVLSRFRSFVSYKNKESVLSLILVFTVLILTFQSFLTGTYLANFPTRWGSSGCPPSLDYFKLGGNDVKLEIDSKNSLWIYQINATNGGKQKAEIVSISGQKPWIKVLGLDFLSQKQSICQPCDENVEVAGGEKTNGKITVEPGSTAAIGITSDNPLFSIYVADSNNCAFTFSFLVGGEEGSGESELPAEVTTASVEEALDPGIKIILFASFPPGEGTNKTAFKTGEVFYPNEQGLPKGTEFFFRVVNVNGITVKFTKPVTAKGEGGFEGSGQFNTGEYPISAGNYKVELVKIENGRGFVVAYSDITIN